MTDTLPDPSPATPPERIQIQHTRGWRMPKGARRCVRPGRYSNPYRVCQNGPYCPDHPWCLTTAAESCRLYRLTVVRQFPGYPRVPTLAAIRRNLAGQTLACWCATTTGYPCHADWLLRVANASDLGLDGLEPEKIVECEACWLPLHPDRCVRDVEGCPLCDECAAAQHAAGVR